MMKGEVGFDPFWVEDRVAVFPVGSLDCCGHGIREPISVYSK